MDTQELIQELRRWQDRFMRCGDGQSAELIDVAMCALQCRPTEQRHLLAVVSLLQLKED